MDVERIIDYLSPAARREVLRVVRQVQEAAERCPTCRSDVRWKRGWMVFDTPCWDPWHSAPLVEGEQG